MNDLITLSKFNGAYISSGFSEFFLSTTAQSGKTLTLYIVRGKPGNMMAEMAVNVTAQVIDQIEVDIVGQTIGSLDINIAGQVGNIDINLAAQVANIDVNLATQAADIAISIDSESITGQIPISFNIEHLTGNIPISFNIANLTGNIPINIAAQGIGNVAIDLAAQSIGNIEVTIAAQSSALNFNIVAASVIMNTRFQSQATGVKLLSDWATQETEDYHTQGETAALAAAGDATLITITLSTTKEHWIYTVHVSGTQNGMARVRANKTAGYDELAHGYFGANDGFIKTWVAPVKRKQDSGEGITTITVVVTNNGDAAGDFAATLDGLTIIDVTAGEQTYTTKAHWDACDTKTDIDTATSEGDVILAVQT